jgi:putative flippase GtrA
VPAVKSREQRLRELFFEIVRFGVVGLTSVGIYFGLLWLFGALTALSLVIRATLAYGLGIIFNYVVQKSFTFRSATHHQHAGPRYMVVQLGGMAINSVALWLGVDVAHWWFPAVQFGAIGLTAIWSYGGQKFWAFQGGTSAVLPDSEPPR